MRLIESLLEFMRVDDESLVPLKVFWFHLVMKAIISESIHSLASSMMIPTINELSLLFTSQFQLVDELKFR